jgi:hypothetical protein
VPPRIHIQEINLDRLADVIREQGTPVSLANLAREAIRSYLTTDNGMPVFAPGGRYSPGTRLRFNGLVGDVVDVQNAQNTVQGDFKILTLRLKDGDRVRVAAEIDQAPTSLSPAAINGQVVDRLYEVQEASLLHRVRQSLATDPRFVTLYYQGEEYGCLREFFPPMSPDVLDTALAVLLDSLFDQGQIPIHGLTSLDKGEPAREGVLLKPSALFSNQYLKRKLKRHPDWDADLNVVYRTIRALWSRARSQGHEWDRQRTETALVQPLLTALGWSSVPLSAFDSHLSGQHLHTARPKQHILCRDQAACAALYTHRGSMRSASGLPLALVQTAPWAGSLDGHSSPNSPWWRQPDDTKGQMSTPSYQIVQALMQHDVPWGILTNGRLWRLFTRRANSVITEFHEVDLGPLFERLSEGETLTTSQWVLLRQWWMLFRRDAFLVDSQGGSFLDRLYESSPARKQESRVYLRKRVVQDVFPAIAGGFVAYRHRRLNVPTEDADSLQLIKRASLSFLTRILFLFVAEARFLLPAENREYRSQSLKTLLSWVDTCVQGRIPPNIGLYTTPRYDILLSLFHRVNTGDASKNLPQYGPVFFDPEIHPVHAFIAEHRLSDAVLAEILHTLQRGVDYASFSAYELIAILEPLVDVNLQVIDARGGEVEVLESSTDVEGHGRIGVPDYVATDVAAQVLQPLIEHRGAEFTRMMDRVVALRRRLQRTLDARGRAEVQAALEAASHEACDTLLGLRVVDPAMGTGTFLLSALDVITDGIIQQIQAYHDAHPDVPWRWNPLHRLFDRVRSDVMSELDRQMIDVEDLLLDDVSVMRRLIAQNCLYGVDRDPVAIDVAEVGVWLRTFVIGAPFVFLDHRLRVGDSLASIDLASLRAHKPAYLEMESMFEAASMMYSVVDRVNTSALDVRWSMKQFERVEQVVRPYRRYFDLSIQAASGDDVAKRCLENPEASLLQVLQEALSVDAEMRTSLGLPLSTETYFHWPLEFLDAFIDLEHRTWAAEPGFDVVVGQVPEVCERKLSKVTRLALGSGHQPCENSQQVYLRMARRLTAQRGGKTSCVLTRQSMSSERAGEPSSVPNI